MICTNCGFQNAPDNRFCASCGHALSPDASNPPTTNGEQPAGDSVSDETQVVETVAPPPTAAPAGPVSAHAQAAADAPSADDSVFCWNCGTRNSMSRRFCHRCGEQLTAGAAGAAGAAGVAGAMGAGDGGGYPPDRYYDDYYDDRDGRGRTVAIAVALLAILLLAGGAMIMFLGDGFGGPNPTPTDAAVVSPSPEPSPSPELSPSPEPSPSPTGEPVPPTAEPTPEPVTPQPATPTPAPATPTPPPATPTPAPTPANCDGFGSPTTSTSLTNENPTRQISSTRIWCVSALVFGNGEGDGTLKIFLTNPVFLTDEYGYSSATIGWTEVFMQDGMFNGSDSISPPMDLIHPVLDQTRSIRMFPQGTDIQLQVMCSPGPDDCSGSVRIDHVRRQAPPLP